MGKKNYTITGAKFPTIAKSEIRIVNPAVFSLDIILNQRTCDLL